MQFPGGVNMQLYWHTTAPSYAKLQTIPENRVYVSPDRADAFIRSFVAFSGGTVTNDNAKAPGVEIGRPGDTYRRVRIASTFGNVAVVVTDGHLPYPYGREVTGYETLTWTRPPTRLPGSRPVEPYRPPTGGRPWYRYIAEIHATLRN